MDELDMSGVDPLRYDEVRRRVGVVKDYLAIPFPTEMDQRAHAVRLDLSVNQFMALVRVWRDHRSAARMAASGAHRGAARRPGHLALNPIAKEEAAKAIEELGPNASLTELMRAIGERCAARGVKAPSRGTIWNMAMERRQDHDSGETGIVIGTCRVRLPLATEDGVQLPDLTMAVRASDGAIVVAALDDADWQTAASTIASTNPTDEVVRADSELLTLRRAANVRAGVVPVPGVKARSAISRILGRGVGFLHLIYQPTRAMSGERLLTTKQDRPLSRAAVRTVVMTAVARHNASRGARDATWIDGISPSKDA